MAKKLRRVTLLRHAKSSWDTPGHADHDRPLNKRGKRDAPIMGKRLLERGARPSLILSSTAKRARETAKLVAAEINYPREFIQSEAALYLATPEKILSVIATQDDNFHDLLVIGHNPGMTELAAQLSGRPIGNLPTAGVVCVEFKLNDWSELGSKKGNLLYFDYPKARAPFGAGH